MPGTIWDLLGLPNGNGRLDPYFPPRTSQAAKINYPQLDPASYGDFTTLAGLSDAAPNGIPYQNWTRSQNLEDNRDASTAYNQLLTPQFWAQKLLKMQQGDNPVIYPGAENTRLAQQAGAANIDSAAQTYAYPKEEMAAELARRQKLLDTFMKYPPQTEAGRQAMQSMQNAVNEIKGKPVL